MGHHWNLLRSLRERAGNYYDHDDTSGPPHYSCTTIDSSLHFVAGFQLMQDLFRDCYAKKFSFSHVGKLPAAVYNEAVSQDSSMSLSPYFLSYTF